MAKSKESFLDKPFMRIILTLISMVISTLVLALSSFTVMEVYQNSYVEAPKFLVWIFILVGLMQVIVYLKKRTMLNLIKCFVLLGFNVIIGVISLFAKDNPFLFLLIGGLYCATIIISRVFEIMKKPEPRTIVLNALIIVCLIFLAIGIFQTSPNEEIDIQGVITLECVFIAIVSFIEALLIIFAQLKVKILFKIVVNTFSLEILFGLLTMIICFSMVLYSIEPNIPTFVDALWYSFAVVTTIGFGDFVAVTPMGRVLTVILGLYGLVSVAVVTSIIVNFYNETSGKRDSKELKEISKHDKD